MSTSEGYSQESVEGIKSAAILYGDELFAGVNHWAAIDELTKKHPNYLQEVNAKKVNIKEGFVTTTGRFITDRKEIAKIAYKNNQWREGRIPWKEGDSLISEDLQF